MKIVKKIFSLLISAFAVLILSGFLTLQPVSFPALAHHVASHACNDVTGTTTPVLSPERSGRKAGVQDSGNFDFNANPPAIDYQACGETAEATIDRVTGNPLRGWAWNTNLGYVSFSCNGGTNLDGACGNIDYQTIVGNNGQVNGWAWGDNIGWISMTCRQGDNVGQDCGQDVTSYSGVRVAQDAAAESATAKRVGCAIAERGDFYGYAWTETVGWVNFCGAHVELTAPLTPSVTIKTSNPPGDPVPEPEPIDGGGADGGTDIGEGPVYANGSDFYKIVVRVNDGATPLDRTGMETHGVRAEDFILDNKLRANQINRCTPVDEGDGLDDCDYNGNLPLPESLNIDNWDASENGLVGYVRAIAPTGNYDNLTLTSFNIVIDGVSYLQDINRSFVFLPAVEVTRIVSESVAESTTDQIVAVRNTQEAVYLTAAKHDGDAVPDTDTDIKIFSQLYNCESPFEFFFDEGEPGIRDIETGVVVETHDVGGTDRENIERHVVVCPGGGELTDVNESTLNEFLSENPASTITRLIFSELPEGTEAPTSIEMENQLGFRTRVEYDAITADPLRPRVRYFSRTVTDGSLLNQAADVRGNVRIDIQKIIREGAIAQSLKNNPKDTQSKREKFYRAVKNTINTRGLPPISGVSAGQLNFISTTPEARALIYYNRAQFGLNFPGDGPCKIILDGSDTPATMNFANNVTIVGEGCDFFIDQNIISPSGRLGIVALEDLSLSGSRRGGNIYICHRVTDVEANIVADGSIFAYGAGETDCGWATSDEKEALLDDNGLPDPRGTRDTALRQLTIVGSIISNNTYGGAFMSPPILGDGTLVTGAAQIPQARLYDMNFLRYARTRPPEETDIDLGVDPDTGICWANSTDQLSKTFSPTTTPNCFNNNPQQNGIVNIIYRAPAKDMKIFGAVR